MSPQQNEVKVSVIVPMYRSADYIEECLSSLKHQTMFDFEAICINDASPDDTLERARLCAGDDGRFSFIVFNENLGPSAARNAAMRVARGEYFVFLDSDDYLVCDALEKIYGRVHDQDLDDLYYSAQSFYESYETYQRVQEDYRDRLSFEEVTSGKELFTFFQNVQQFFPQACFHAVRRAFIEEQKIKFLEGILHEDVLFSYQVIVAAKRASFLNEPLYRRRLREGSIMSAPRRTLDNVNGLFMGMFAMKLWLYEHASELDLAFVEAMTESMSEFLLIAAYDWLNVISDKDKTRYLAELDHKQRIAFFEDVIARGNAVAAVKQEYRNSITYRVGNALLKGPRVVKDRIGSNLRYRKEKT